MHGIYKESNPTGPVQIKFSNKLLAWEMMGGGDGTSDSSLVSDSLLISADLFWPPTITECIHYRWQLDHLLKLKKMIKLKTKKSGIHDHRQISLISGEYSLAGFS